MIYYALRSSETYLTLLAAVRDSPEAHDLLSVIGGLAFLHAISDKTRSLTLVDCDADAEPYCRLILRLIDLSTNAQEFLSFLSGRKVKKEWWQSEPFGAGVDYRPFLRSALKEEPLYQLYLNTYGSMEFNATASQAKIARSTIEFFKFDLAPTVFCWLFGQGNLKDEQTFSKLKANLKRLNIKYRFQNMQQLNYAEFTHAELPLYVLASNCDSPLFTQNDPILHRILETARGTVYYFSWTRSLRLERDNNLEKQKQQLTKIINEYVENKTVYEICDAESLIAKVELGVKSHILIKGLAELRAKMCYAEDVLLLSFISAEAISSSEKEHIIKDLVCAAFPNFKRIILIDTLGENAATNYIDWLQAIKLHQSYYLSLLEWTTQFFIQIWELRGQINRKER
jgi:hypothetical protein